MAYNNTLFLFFVYPQPSRKAAKVPLLIFVFSVIFV
jgi:hypothetical protein